VRAADLLANHKAGSSGGRTSSSDLYSSSSLGLDLSGGGAGAGKRQRDATGAPVATEQKPLKSSEEVMAAVGVTRDIVDSCMLRCGVGGLVPMRGAVRRMLVDTVRRFSALLDANVMRLCMEKVLRTLDRMLSGLQAGALQPSFQEISSFKQKVMKNGFSQIFPQESCGSSPVQKPP
jgi:hypothetical protein